MAECLLGDNSTYLLVASTEAVKTTVGSAESCCSSAMACSGLSAPVQTSLYSFRLLGSAYLHRHGIVQAAPTVPQTMCKLCG